MVVIPPRDPNAEPTQVSIRTSLGLIAEIEILVEKEKRSRNEIAAYLWNAGLEAYWKEHRKERPANPLDSLKAISPMKAASIQKANPIPKRRPA